MATETRRTRKARAPLTRERVLDAALLLADSGGVASLTMRKLAQTLSVEAMSLYHHVAHKDRILDGIVDLVFSEVELPVDGGDWKTAMRRRAHSVREALSRHPWAIGLMESRHSPGPATLRHHDAVLGCLRAAGFTVAMASHAFSLLDSYIYGFLLQETSLPFRNTAELEAVGEAILEAMPAGAYPHLTEMMTDHALKPGYANADEFGFGLDLILDGLERSLGAR